MKKKILALVLCLVFAMAPIATIGVFAAADSGYTLSGTTYTVTTADGLIAVAAAINGDANKAAYNITLAADIDMQGKNWTPIGAKGKAAYEGTFDGANFTIKNFSLIVDYQTVGKAGYCSLIGKANDGCTVKNLKFTGANVMGVELNSLVIGETAQKDANVTTKKVLVENVHVRDSIIKGSNGWGSTPTSVNVNEYTGAIIGKAGANYNEVKNCTVVANITSECRTAGLVGGESIGSSVAACGITISNCIVGGNITNAKVSTGSNTLKSGGASVFFGYHSTVPLTLTNCVSIATLASDNDLAGAISFQSNKLTLTAEKCVFTASPFGKVNDVSVGTTTMSDISIYKVGETATESPVADNLNSKDTSPVKFNGADSTWGTAKLPVISTKDAFESKVSAIFAGNTVVTSDMINEIIGHEHAYTNEVVDAKYLKSAATCTAAAIYYKSCACGGFDVNATFTSGDPLAHTPSDKWTNDEDNHWHICSGCLEEKSDVAAHTFGDWEVTKEATEKREGEKTKTCTVCGLEVTEKIDKVAPATEATDEVTETVNESGCGGAVLGMSAVMIATLGVGALCLRKKED
ncbi:MAG: hypothetical protein IJZ83_03470 [Clostridia bacterium]|nr:hypothetical protein [Clostridia bacterium]